MSQMTAVSLRASAAAVASGSGAAVDLGSDTTIELDLAVTAIAGTLAVFVETSRDGINGWSTLEPTYWDASAATELPVRFATVSAAGAQHFVFPDCRRFVRVSWTLSAAGSATFAVTGSSTRVYALTTDMKELQCGPGGNCKSISSERKDRALRAETDKADSALGMQMPTPLSAWDSYIRQGVAMCATATIIKEDGCKVREKDEWILKACELFDEWLDKVAKGERKPPGAVDPTPTVSDGGAYAISDAKRGW